MHIKKKHLIKFYMSCLWKQLKYQMLHKKAFTKKPLIFYRSKFKILTFQTSF